MLPMNPFSGWTTCIGNWCENKKFRSRDKRYERYCPKCRAMKEKIENGKSGIRVYSLRDPSVGH
jgi:Zn finger protein HypA/HybF involved in hydrogenase expression